ncbi:uncharacterized protein LOC109850307 [Asparagus officinalis]|uniref:uncharacterized protein LOC109850307 n=1 Tax=Asparagus officinalis TaxID=4686 RepID=UPI00098E6B4C|nr:uncharacterized protein LOC109850307 [Asparagus officinalis]
MATQLRLKLLIDTKSNKVLFAEAGKEVVDFLFGLLSLPLGSVIKHITDEKMVGCVGSLYKSAENLDETYFASNENKTSFLNPISKNTLFLTGTSSTPAPTAGRKSYRCPINNCASYPDAYGACCSCGCKMTTETVSTAGIVKGMVTYSVMDDLTITPMSAISCITLLSKFHVKDVGSLEERTVNMGMSEGLKLLKASLQSKTVLTDVFIDRKAATKKAR